MNNNNDDLIDSFVNVPSSFIYNQSEITSNLNLSTLYHIGLSYEEAKIYFQNVEFVCIGGTKSRMKSLALMIGKHTNETFSKISEGRFTLFKVG